MGEASLMKKPDYWQQLFARYARNQATPAQRRLLDLFYQQQAQGPADEVWAAVGETPAQVRHRLKAQIDRRRQPAAPGRWPLLRLAAAVLVLLGAGALFFFRPGAKLAPAEPLRTVAARNGEHRQVTLPDGTRILLNCGSTLQWYPAAYNRRQRRVYLRGEAFFSVHHDARRPFEVVTAQLTTRVLGTRFDVRTYDGRYAVAVASGKVRVTPARAGAPGVYLTARQQAALDPATGRLRARSSSPDAYAWTDKALVFKNVPLAQVVSQLERWYAVRIRYDAALAGAQITARYQRAPLEHVLKSLAFSLRCTYRRGPGPAACLQLASPRIPQQPTVPPIIP